MGERLPRHLSQKKHQPRVRAVERAGVSLFHPVSLNSAPTPVKADFCGTFLSPHPGLALNCRLDPMAKNILYFDLETQKSADEVGGWNNISRMGLSIGVNYLRFDYEVLHGYTAFDLRQLPTLDLMLELQNQLQHRLSLDSIATAT